jgi:hypothetical protein
MKALMNGLIVIAIANLIAIAAFIGWLATNDRLDMDRVRKLRQMVSQTITDEKAKAAADAAAVAVAKSTAEQAAKAAQVPLTASEQLSARLEATELDKERLARLKREVENLQRRLAEQNTLVAQGRAALESDRKKFQQMTVDELEKTKSEQFQKALGVLSSLKPAAAKTMLTRMLEGAADDFSQPAASPATPATAANGSPASPPAATPERVQRVVLYLDAMEERVRTKVMTEFAKDDPVMASRLLNELRDKGKLAAPAAPPARAAADTANPG